MDKLSESSHGYTELEASSLAVGLPEGLMGNSEVGHLNIGAGRVVWQDVVRIDQTVKKDELKDNDVIKKTFKGAAQGNGRLHLCGLVSHGGVVSFATSHAESFFGKADVRPALQADSPLRPSQGCQGTWRGKGLYTLFR